MYSKVRTDIKVEHKEALVQKVNSSDSEDSKSMNLIEESNMDYANRTHDFSKISNDDLDAAFELLCQRCPKSWNKALEDRARAFHKKVLTLRGDENLSDYIDPNKAIHSTIDSKNEYDAKDLIISPALWNMQKVDAAIELRELLRHLTIYAPFKGRPFVRAWLEALLPCFSRWILLSDGKNEGAIQTLKHFLGAFGQPGIVVCLEDKGLTLLNSLQDAAHSVEALGRGTVERYY